MQAQLGPSHDLINGRQGTDGRACVRIDCFRIPPPARRRDPMLCLPTLSPPYRTARFPWGERIEANRRDKPNQPKQQRCEFERFNVSPPPHRPSVPILHAVLYTNEWLVDAYVIPSGLTSVRTTDIAGSPISVSCGFFRANDRKMGALFPVASQIPH